LRPTYGMGRTEGLTRAFKKYPLGFPLCLIVFGGGLLWLTLQSKSHFVFAASLLIIILAMGVITLPFGIAITLRRVFFPTILRCPHCGTEARSAIRPF
jgi:apolipoprotein N-acyltransferase